MKKATLILISILLALFAFTACNNSIDYIIDDQPTDPMYMPLTLEFLADGKLSIAIHGEYGPSDVYYSRNDGARMLLEVGTLVSVYTGDKICLYRDGGARSSAPNFRIECTSDCYVYGNVMSLIDSENFAEVDAVPAWSLCGLFDSNTHIINHESLDLVLPATTLDKGCYAGMFSGCEKLERAPELPATTLAANCYTGMFAGCTALTTAPEILPATTLATSCYESMFAGCTALTTAPELPANTLAADCYYSMFEACTSLTTVPDLPADELAHGCYDYMFSNCSSLQFSTTQGEGYQVAFTIGSGGYEADYYAWNMFYGTATPVPSPVSLNTTYYYKVVSE